MTRIERQHRYNVLPVETGGFRMARKATFGRCTCGCGEFKFMLLNEKGEVFAVLAIPIDEAEDVARITLAEAEEVRAEIKHGGVGHA